MNKKFLTSALCALLVGGLLTTGTMAYFQDTDKADNVFTSGNVNIALKEDFEGTESNPAKLIPTTGKVNGQWTNAIKKEVTVKNEGTEAAFVRVHIAIPSCLDDGNPNFAAVNNFVHFNYDSEDFGAGKWTWGTPKEAWNFYTTTIKETVNEVEQDVNYNVYVVTYQTAVAAGVKLEEKAMTQVYLDQSVEAVFENGEVVAYKDKNGKTVDANFLNRFQIKVFAEGVQEAGFEGQPFAALNAAFGDPMEAGYIAPWKR